jgi:DNA mismatch repair protein MutL
MESDQVTGRLFPHEETEVGQVTFQLQNKYIICPIKSGMMVIHQHRAHERVLYEELLKNITMQEAVSQQLLFPLQLHFSKPDMEILTKIEEQLTQTGFVFSEIQAEKVEISGIPVSILESQIDTILQQLITDIRDEIPEAGFSQNDLLAKSMAKSMAVKTGMSIDSEAREHLVNQLFACKEPSVSPSNRAVILTMGTTDFDKKFN